MPKTSPNSTYLFSEKLENTKNYLKTMNKLNNMEQRTTQQNKAVHKYFELLAEELNSAGLDMRVVLKPSYQIWWTSSAIKENIWKPVQDAMYKKQSTTELTRKEIDKVYEQINQLLAEKWGVSVPFPSNEPPLLEEI